MDYAEPSYYEGKHFSNFFDANPFFFFYFAGTKKKLNGSDEKCTVKYINCAKLSLEDTHMIYSDFLYTLFI